MWTAWSLTRSGCSHKQIGRCKYIWRQQWGQPKGEPSNNPLYGKFAVEKFAESGYTRETCSLGISGIRALFCCTWYVKFFKWSFLWALSYKNGSTLVNQTYPTSTWLFLRRWLICIQHLPCLVSFWCMLRGSVEVWTKNILYQFIEGQTHMACQEVLKWVWPPMNRYRFKSKHYLRACTTSGNKSLIIYVLQLMGIHRVSTF